MIWVKVASAMKFTTGAAGTDRDWPFAVQDWGLKIMDVVYAIFASQASANVEIGAIHRNLRPGQAPEWNRDFFHEHGLHRLRGTVRYPGKSTMSPSDRPPVSRVREIRMHGLKGGF